MIAFYNAMINRPDRTSTLKQARFPVQWIIGKEDSAVPPEVVLPQTRLAAVNYVSLYGNTGHMSMLEQTGKLNNDLKQFIHYCYYQ
jgi:pimeloyl-ACP methyl ester carboxylesterase